MRICKLEDEQQIVYGEVYAPNVLDSHGDMMTKGEIEKMAHRFLQNVLSKSIDANHDNVPRNAYPVESFIARDGDTDYTPGAWVLAVKIDDATVWREVKKGNLNGYSFEAYIQKTPTVVMVETEPFLLAETEPDPEDGHTHLFAIRIDDEGKIVEGKTSSTNGHSHMVVRGTATEVAVDNGRIHSHRIFT